MNTAASSQFVTQPWSQDSVHYLSVVILTFFAFALLLATLLLWRSKAAPSECTKLIGVLAVVGVTSFLLVAGYTSEQLTPAIGLFGAIVGYLLGKDATAPK